MMFTILDAFVSLCPDAKFSAEGNEYSGVTWLSPDIPMPTEAEATAEVNRLQAEHEAKQYQRNRAKAYPSVIDQLDTLYHGGYDAWKTQVKAIKDKYPKGTE